MSYSFAQQLQSLGVPTELGMELQRQAVAATGNMNRLMNVSMEPDLAKYVATSITGNNFDPKEAVAFGMIPAVAVKLTQLINAPANTAVPTITGTAQVGQTLTRTTGTWTGSPTPTYTQQWYANGVAIVGATNTTYVPIMGQIGQTITVVVTGTNTAGSASATSAATAAVIAA
jgi:hypothetical protein